LQSFDVCIASDVLLHECDIESSARNNRPSILSGWRRKQWI